MPKSLRETWRKTKTQLTKDLGAKFVSKNFKQDLGPGLDKIEKGSSEIQKGVKAATKKINKMSAADLGKTVQIFDGTLAKIKKELTSSKKTIKDYGNTIQNKAEDKGKTQIVANWPKYEKDLTLQLQQIVNDAEEALDKYREDVDRRYLVLQQDAEELRALANSPVERKEKEKQIKERDKNAGKSADKVPERPYERGR